MSGPQAQAQVHVTSTFRGLGHPNKMFHFQSPD